MERLLSLIPGGEYQDFVPGGSGGDGWNYDEYGTNGSGGDDFTSDGSDWDDFTSNDWGF